MALLKDGELNVFSLRKIIKELNSSLKAVRSPLCSELLIFNIPEDSIVEYSKEIKNAYENEEDFLGSEVLSKENMVLIDMNEIELNTNSIDGLSLRMTALAMHPYASMDMFGTIEFLNFKMDLEKRLNDIIRNMASVKENSLNPNCYIEGFINEGGKPQFSGSRFKINLQIFFYQLS